MRGIMVTLQAQTRWHSLWVSRLHPGVRSSSQLRCPAQPHPTNANQIFLTTFSHANRSSSPLSSPDPKSSNEIGADNSLFLSPFNEKDAKCDLPEYGKVHCTPHMRCRRQALGLPKPEVSFARKPPSQLCPHLKLPNSSPGCADAGRHPQRLLFSQLVFLR